MGKWAKYSRTYRNEWDKDLEFKALPLQQNQLETHVTSLPRPPSYTREIKIAQLRLAAHISVHGSLAFADHLTPQISDTFIGSFVASSLSMCRTKFTALVTKVLGQTFKKLLLDDAVEIMDYQYCCGVSREHNRAAGVAIYVRKGLSAVPIEIFGTSDEVVELLSAKFDNGLLVVALDLVGKGSSHPRSGDGDLLCGPKNSPSFYRVVLELRATSAVISINYGYGRSNLKSARHPSLKSARLPPPAVQRYLHPLQEPCGQVGPSSGTGSRGQEPCE
ncbi:hypothetical protein HPB47_006445 [Ixodes persulcatus]|uniref:Uncharacterized protein n=1 Tax=Ixodes persulcatus TaxID=34615 RepID=A0AC60PB68_IXOPE|nr:hypothetical protein HPB47_006445 [Ixodes persulcatus]